MLNGNPPAEEKRAGFEQQLKAACSQPRNTMTHLFVRLLRAVLQLSVNLNCGLGLQVRSIQWQMVM